MTDATRSPRLPAIDIARGVALIGMAVFHFTFDLEYFGLVPGGTILSLPWSQLRPAGGGQLRVPRRRQPGAGGARRAALAFLLARHRQRWTAAALSRSA